MLTANNQGKLKGKVKVPANIPAGTKLVQFYGDKGSYGETTYTGKKPITIEERRRVIVARRVDPLVQTFTLNESRHIGGLDLWFINNGKYVLLCRLEKQQWECPRRLSLLKVILSQRI